MSNWVAGYNMAGYLPEMDPFVTADHAAARSFLADELDRHGDQAFEVGDATLGTMLTEAMDEVKQLPDGQEWGAIIGYTSYWIATTDEEPDDDAS